jgi:hypothetical protein
MAHFAELDESNIVKQVIVVHNNELLVDGVESEAKGIEFCIAHYGGTWVQTSYNATFGGKFAGTGDTWDGANFIAPEPVEEPVVEEPTE